VACLLLVGSGLAGCAPVAAPAQPAARAAPPEVERPAYAGDPLAIAFEVAQARTDAAPPPVERPFVAPARREPTVDPMEFTHNPPPRFARVFEARRQFHFIVVDDVDPHGEEGRRARSRTSVTCTVQESRELDGMVGAQLACFHGSSETDDGPSFPLAFVSAPGGIWMPSSLPATQAAAGDLIHLPPTLAEFPKARKHVYDRPGMFEDEVDRCTQRVEVAGESTCYEETCHLAQGYGDTKLRVCLSSRGVEFLQMENLEGPRITKWQLQRTELPPEPESGCHG